MKGKGRGLPCRKEPMKRERKQFNATKFLATASLIAALYIALTYLAMAFGLDKNAIQVRFSEALVALCLITPAAIPGLTVGCLLANILTGCAPLDIALGPVATLIGCIGAYYIGKLMRKTRKTWLAVLAPLPTVLANTAIVPFVIYVCYTAPGDQDLAILPFFALTVFLGEIISAEILGTALYFALRKRKILNYLN